MEVCLSGLPLRDFPTLLAVRKTENPPQLRQPRRRYSIDIELAEAVSFSDHTCSHKQPNAENQEKEVRGNKGVTHDENGDGQIGITAQLAKCLSYTNNKFDDEKSDDKSGKWSTSLSPFKERTQRPSGKKCIVVICPSYWSFKNVRRRHLSILVYLYTFVCCPSLLCKPNPS